MAPVPEPTSEGPHVPPFQPLNSTGCQSMTTFFLEPISVAAKWLPPGFFARDLSDFLAFNYAVSNRVPVFMAVVHCEDADPGGPLTLAFAGFYVHPPTIAPADIPAGANFNSSMAHDFYVLQYWTPQLERLDALAQLHWPVDESAAAVAIDLPAGAPAPLVLPSPGPSRVQVATSEAQVGQQFSSETAAAFPQRFQQPPLLRFWHQGEYGLGWMQYQLYEDTFSAGAVLDCSIKPDSLLYQITEREPIAQGRGACLTVDSFTLVMPDHRLVGGLWHLPGVEPQ